MRRSQQLRWVATELERMAPNAPTPEGQTSHVGRRAFMTAALALRASAATSAWMEQYSDMAESLRRSLVRANAAMLESKHDR